MAGGICLVVHLPDKLALCEDDGGPSMLEISVWQLMPQDLLDRILLFVPASRHAGLRFVCKRWSQLVTSSAFRKESERIAFRRGPRNFVCCKLELARVKEAGGDLCKVDMPGATTSLPGLDINSSRIKVFYGAGPVGVAHLSDEGILDCWLLNVADKTCRQLPRLFLNSNCSSDCRWEPSHWQIWLEPAPESSGSSESDTLISSFHVVLLAFHPCAIDINDSSSAALYTYSSTSTCTGWRTVHRPFVLKWWSCAVTKGGYVSWFRDIGDSKRVRMSWDSDCITELPHPPLGVELILDPSTAAVFGWKVDESTLSLYRLDESSGWRCLYSGRPPQLRRPELHPTRIYHVQAKMILGNMLILVCSIWEYREQHVLSHVVSRVAMAYHMHDGSCQWFRPPAQAFLYWSEQKGVFLEPTLVSHRSLKALNDPTLAKA